MIDAADFGSCRLRIPETFTGLRLRIVAVKVIGLARMPLTIPCTLVTIDQRFSGTSPWTTLYMKHDVSTSGLFWADSQFDLQSRGLTFLKFFLPRILHKQWRKGGFVLGLLGCAFGWHHLPNHGAVTDIWLSSSVWTSSPVSSSVRTHLILDRQKMVVISAQ